MINRIVIQRSRPLTRDYNWLCISGDEEFRLNVFTSLDVTVNGRAFPPGTAWVNINWPEIRRVKKNMILDVDFVVRCPRGQALYNDMAWHRNHGAAAWYNAPKAAQAINRLRAHVRCCHECRSAINVVTMSIGGDDGYNW